MFLWFKQAENGGQTWDVFKGLLMLVEAVKLII